MKNKLDWFDDNWNWDVRPAQELGYTTHTDAL